MGHAVKWSATAVLLILGITAGCVTKEVYNAQVNRTTNLQRLLAEEEKRSADLSGEIAKLKQKVSDLEAQNKLATSQLTDARAQVVRSMDEVGRLQEEVQRARTTKHQPAASKPKPEPSSPAATEPPDRLDELQFDVPSAGKKAAKSSMRSSGETSTRLPGELTGTVYHDVERGDTLFNIAKRYKTDVKMLKELNGLTSDNIELGQRLIVRKE